MIGNKFVIKSLSADVYTTIIQPLKIVNFEDF